MHRVQYFRFRHLINLMDRNTKRHEPKNKKKKTRKKEREKKIKETEERRKKIAATTH